VEIIPFGVKVLVIGTATDLFVSDGTPAGSHGFNFAGGLPQGFTALGDKVLFEAQDRARREGLWITDGTFGGTHEIPIRGAFSRGIFGNFVDFAGTVIGNEVVFAGTDRLQRNGLWVTDGTTAGTHEIEAPLSIKDLTGVPAAKAAKMLAAATAGAEHDCAPFGGAVKPGASGSSLAGVLPHHPAHSASDVFFAS
jgi:hypothetical protein